MIIKKLLDYWFDKKYLHENIVKEHLNLQIAYSTLENKRTSELNEKNEQVLQLEKKLSNLRVKYDLLMNPPKIIKPAWLIGTMAYKPRRRIVSKNTDKHYYFSKPQHSFDKSNMLYDCLEANNLLNIEKTVDNMFKVHKLIVQLTKYEHDKIDNWRPATDILMSKLGDCDDSSLLIASALGMAGWKETEVFVATGHYKGLCHAWTVCKAEKDWYVLEGTSKYSVPILWDSIKETYKADLGLVNWKFSGMIRNKKLYLKQE